MTSTIKICFICVAILRCYKYAQFGTKIIFIFFHTEDKKNVWPDISSGLIKVGVYRSALQCKKQFAALKLKRGPVIKKWLEDKQKTGLLITSDIQISFFLLGFHPLLNCIMYYNSIYVHFSSKDFMYDVAFI